MATAVVEEAPNGVDNPLGQRIRQARLTRELRQIDLAEQAGLSRSVVNDLENGRPRDLGVSKFYRLAAALGVTMEWLLDEPDLCGRMKPDDWFDAIDWDKPTWTALDDAASTLELTDEDVRMLASVTFRGQRPTTQDQWCLLYSVIRLAIQHAEGWAWREGD